MRQGTRASDHIKIEEGSCKGDRIKTHVMFNPLAFLALCLLPVSFFYGASICADIHSELKHVQIKKSDALPFLFLFVERNRLLSFFSEMFFSSSLIVASYFQGKCTGHGGERKHAHRRSHRSVR